MIESCDKISIELIRRTPMCSSLLSGLMTFENLKNAIAFFFCFRYDDHQQKK